MWWCALLATAAAWDVLGPGGTPTGRTLDPHAHFVPYLPSWYSMDVSTSPLDLGLVAAETADTIRRLRVQADLRAEPGILSELGVSADDVLATLDLVARTAFEDRGAYHQRLLDPAWITSQFEALRWQPDVSAAAERDIALGDDAIRLTKYVVYTVSGSLERTARFDTALYAVPTDEVEGGEPGIRMMLSRMDVYAGAFESGGQAEGLAQALVWLPREGVNQALLQGTVRVMLPHDVAMMYNVDKNNGEPWDPAVKDLDQQARYWYFRHVDQILGVEATPLRPAAAVAGDLFNLGLGAIVALEWPTKHGVELRLVVLADTGGAFQPNLFQLDFLAGAFPSKRAFQAWARSTPTRVPATILVRRE